MSVVDLSRLTAATSESEGDSRIRLASLDGLGRFVTDDALGWTKTSNEEDPGGNNLGGAGAGSKLGAEGLDDRGLEVELRAKGPLVALGLGSTSAERRIGVGNVAEELNVS